MLRRFLLAWARWWAERRKVWYFVPVGSPTGRIRRMCPWDVLRGLERELPEWESLCDLMGSYDPDAFLKLPPGCRELADIAHGVGRLAAAGRSVFGMRPLGDAGDRNTDQEACLAVMRFRPFMTKLIVDAGIPPFRRANAPGGGILSRFVEPDTISTPR